MSRSESTATRRALLAGAPAAAAVALTAGTATGALAAAATGPVAPDPIFAVITKHRANMRAWQAVLDAEETADTDAERDAWDPESGAAMEAFEASIGNVLTRYG